MPQSSLPAPFQLDALLRSWLAEDIGRGDRTTQALFPQSDPTEPTAMGTADLVLKQAGVMVGLPLVQRVFALLSDQAALTAAVTEGGAYPAGTVVARLRGPMAALLTGERLALNLVMHLSGIATLTRQYVAQIADLPTQLVDTRKTTPGLRPLEKYATQMGGAINHRWGLDDAVMIKDNHIVAAGGIAAAIKQVRIQVPFPLAIEVETETLEQVQAALDHRADIIMLDNMPLARMQEAVQLIRTRGDRTKIEASGNITLETIRAIAETGVDYISSSAPITQATWLDLSLRFVSSGLESST